MQRLLFLYLAIFKCMGEFIDAEDKGDVTWDIGVPGAAWDLGFSNTVLTRVDLMS